MTRAVDDRSDVFASRRSAFTGSERYQVVRLLGEGGFGAVYEVFDRERDERVALKTLQRLGADALYRFKKEFRLLADVSNPYLVTLHELFAEGDLWYFTMELIRGRELLSYVFDEALAHEPTIAVDGLELARSNSAASGARKALADEKKLRWVLGELAKAVASLHALGVLHRDLKPGNVLVSDTGQVKLLDFGLAKEAGVDASNTNEIVGTVAYMAPEQARGLALT